MELSSLPGKPVLSPAGETLGYVKSAYICKNRELSSLACVNDREEEFFLPAKELSFSDDGVIAGKRRLRSPSGEPCPVGRAVFDRFGKFLGHCEEMDTDAGTISVFRRTPDGLLTALTVPLSRVALGDVLLVSSEREKKATHGAKNATQVAKTKQTAESDPPEQAFGVIGKRVKKQVAGVAETGDTVTPATLKLARENNKLLELTANTLTE